jgi:hypothetical protein
MFQKIQEFGEKIRRTSITGNEGRDSPTFNRDKRSPSKSSSSPFILKKSNSSKLTVFEQVRKIQKRILELEPNLENAVKKIILYDNVLKNLKKDVEKFKNMVQDICFHQIILSQGFETIFNRSDDNEDIHEHYQRSAKVANTVRGKFETDLKKKVLEKINKHLQSNINLLKDVLSWYDDVNAKLLSDKNNLSDVEQRLVQVELSTRANNVMTEMKSIYDKRFDYLRVIFTNFQYIQKHWFVASGRAFIEPSALDNNNNSNIFVTFPNAIFSYLPLNELLNNAASVSSQWRYKVFQRVVTTTTMEGSDRNDLYNTQHIKAVPYKIVLSLSYSKSLHSFVRNSWLPMLESTSKVSSIEKLLSIVYPPGSVSRIIKKHILIKQVEDAYIKLKEKLEKNISDSVEDPMLSSLFATIDRDVERTYGKMGKEIIVHDDEDEMSFWQQQAFVADQDDSSNNNNGASTLNVEQMVSAALGHIDMHDKNSTDAKNGSNGTEALNIRRASEDYGLLMEDSDILAAKKRTKNVLRAFVLANKRVSYVQGMNFIVRALLKLCDNNESESFALLLSLFEFYGYDEIAANDLGRLKVCLFQLESLIRVSLPTLHEHFVAENVDTMMYASGWFMTLFTRNDVLSPTLSLEVLKQFFLFGWPILFKISLAILFALERMLLSRDFESMVKFLQNARSKISKEYPTPKELFKKANEFKVTSKQLLRFEELYRQSK